MVMEIDREDKDTVEVVKEQIEKVYGKTAAQHVERAYRILTKINDILKELNEAMNEDMAKYEDQETKNSIAATYQLMVVELCLELLQGFVGLPEDIMHMIVDLLTPPMIQVKEVEDDNNGYA